MSVCVAKRMATIVLSCNRYDIKHGEQLMEGDFSALIHSKTGEKKIEMNAA